MERVLHLQLWPCLRVLSKLALWRVVLIPSIIVVVVYCVIPSIPSTSTIASFIVVLYPLCVILVTKKVEMPRRSSKRRNPSRSQSQTDDTDEDVNGGLVVEGEEEEDVKPPASQRSRRSMNSQDDEDDDDEDEEVQFMFSQQAPDMSQNLLPERPSDKRNLENMDSQARNKALTSLSRLILFKALSKEPIDRLKICKEAKISDDRIATAAFQEAADRLHNVFGFELKRIPKFMLEQKSIPKRFHDRFYVRNAVSALDLSGAHSKTIHAVHEDSALEKGFLMLTLALIFCKGESHADGSRWILGRDLYRLLHSVDDSLPEEPPQQGTARAKVGMHSHQLKTRRKNENVAPSPDYLLDKFVQQDYLIKEKATEDNLTGQQLEEGDVLYTMGPRSAMEVGRKQVIHFCAEILDEEPCPTMLKEIEEDEEEEMESQLQDDEGYMEPLEMTQ